MNWELFFLGMILFYLITSELTKGRQMARLHDQLDTIKTILGKSYQVQEDNFDSLTTKCGSINQLLERQEQRERPNIRLD